MSIDTPSRRRVLQLAPALLIATGAAAETSRPATEPAVSYYSDYHSFVGRDEKGHVYLALDTNRGRDHDRDLQVGRARCQAHFHVAPHCLDGGSARGRQAGDHDPLRWRPGPARRLERLVAALSALALRAGRQPRPSLPAIPGCPHQAGRHARPAPHRRARDLLARERPAAMRRSESSRA